MDSKVMSEFKFGDFVVCQKGIPNIVFIVDENDLLESYMGLVRHATPEEIKAGRRLS